MAKFNKDSVSGTVTVVVLLSLVCSIVVSGAAVALKSKQDEQKALDVQRNILTVAGLMKEDNASVIKDTYSKFIEPRLVALIVFASGATDTKPYMVDHKPRPYIGNTTWVTLPCSSSLFRSKMNKAM